MAERVGASLHDEVPDAAGDFLARQPLVIVGYADRAGAVWASLLAGEPGFARAVDSHVVALDAEPGVGDPLHEVWISGTPVGLLAIEFLTRRRMRVNGRLAGTERGAMTVAVRQIYANCPKYIQAREWGPAPDFERPGLPTRADRLSAKQQDWIGRSDTFFIATAHPEAGADASHRGGDPGFVRVEDGAILTFPDYAGNNMFNTLGNLSVNPRSGLLFVDFATGSTLQVTGEAGVDWSPDRAAALAGAQRIVEFRVTQVIETTNAIALRGRFREAWPLNPR